jgi:hypothetical protein
VHARRALGPVAASTSRRTSVGRTSAISCATNPPIENPSRSIRSRPSGADERDHLARRLRDRAARLPRRGPDAGIVDQDHLALGGERIGQRGVPVVEVAAEVLQQHQRHPGGAPKAAVREVDACCLDEPRLGRVVSDIRGDGHERLLAIASRMIAAYSAGASSQTKWPASMTLRRLLGSRASRNSALASGTTRSWRPLMIVTGVVVELVGERPHALGGPAVDLQCRAREVRVRDKGAEGEDRRRVRGERVLGRDRRCPGRGHAEHRGDHAFIVGSVRFGCRDEPSATDGEVEPGDEDQLLIVVDSIEDRNVSELPGGQRRSDRLREDLAVDDTRDGGVRERVDQGLDRHVAQARRRLILAPHDVGERLAECLRVA